VTGDEQAEVVNIGGGAIGTSVAYHLTEFGVTDVVIVERDVLGAGSTSKAAGGIRTQFSDELNVQIGLRSLAEFESFADFTGVDIAFHQHGYLFLIDNDSDAAAFRAAIELQRRLGLPNVELSVTEAEALVPGVANSGLVAATFSPRDGHAAPEAVVRGYAAVAASRGVRIHQGEEVTSVRLQGDRVTAVETTRRSIGTSAVVCAAGAWSAAVAAEVGLDLPVQGERRSLHYVANAADLPTELPLTIDFTSGFYFHREGEGLIFGGRENDLANVAPAVTRRFPLLGDLPVHSSWSGLYEMSPDHNGLVGVAPGATRFLYATGFSGHGFQQAPAVGEHVAELLVGTSPTLDLAPLSVERLRGQWREERMVV
jgi:sarcosine oxidase, subunit beta